MTLTRTSVACLIVALPATIVAALTFGAGMYGPFTAAAVVVVISLAGVFVVDHLAHERARRDLERQIAEIRARQPITTVYDRDFNQIAGPGPWPEVAAEVWPGLDLEVNAGDSVTAENHRIELANPQTSGRRRTEVRGGDRVPPTE